MHHSDNSHFLVLISVVQSLHKLKLIDDTDYLYTNKASDKTNWQKPAELNQSYFSFKLPFFSITRVLVSISSVIQPHKAEKTYSVLLCQICWSLTKTKHRFFLLFIFCKIKKNHTHTYQTPCILQVKWNIWLWCDKIIRYSSFLSLLFGQHIH